MSKQKGGSSVDKGRGNKIRKKEGKQTGGGKKRNRIEREKKMGEINKTGDFLGIPMVEARRSEKKSRSTHLELRVGTKILELCQTPRGREFSYLDYF